MGEPVPWWVRLYTGCLDPLLGSVPAYAHHLRAPSAVLDGVLASQIKNDPALAIAFGGVNQVMEVLSLKIDKNILKIQRSGIKFHLLDEGLDRKLF